MVATIPNGFPAETICNQSLQKYSTFRIGGPADYFYDCRDLNEIPGLIQAAQAQGVPFLVIGGGSNTVFSEQGFRGLVIRLAANKVSIAKEIVVAEAGVIFNALIIQSINAGLLGMENLFGIPGTLGGAIRGNAGAHGTEICELLQSITYFDTTSQKIITSSVRDFSFDYRNSSFKQWQQADDIKIILSATLRLKVDPQAAKIAKENLFQTQKIRNAKYPAQPNCGSFFKNPGPAEASELLKSHPDLPRSSGNIPAGWLVEQAGLKGKTEGGAQVSEKHGNFLINKESATQTDLLVLKQKIQSAVAQKFQINLEEEVQFISETGCL